MKRTPPKTTLIKKLSNLLNVMVCYGYSSTNGGRTLSIISLMTKTITSILRTLKLIRSLPHQIVEQIDTNTRRTISPIGVRPKMDASHSSKKDVREKA